MADNDTDSEAPDTRQLREWLPLAANGTLPPAQQARLQAGLASHPGLQHELRWLQTLRQTVQDRPLDPMPGGDLGWSKFEQRLALDAQKTRSAPRSAPRGWAARLRDWLEPRFMPALAMACVLLVAQTVLIGTLLRPDPGYDAAGAVEPVPGAASGVLLQVTVRPTATEAQWREALQRFNASIVQGPTALGVYTLRVQAAGDARALAQRLLAEAGAVFDSASPAEGP